MTEHNDFMKGYDQGHANGVRSGYHLALSDLLKMASNASADGSDEGNARWRILLDTFQQLREHGNAQPADLRKETRHWPWITEDPDQYFKDAAHRDGID